MTPEKIATQLRSLANALESGSGGVRWICAVFCVESELPGVPPGPGMVRLSRNDADPGELADAVTQAQRLVGQYVIPVG